MSALQGQTRRAGIATQPATDGVREGQFYLNLTFINFFKEAVFGLCSICVSLFEQILPGVRIIIANPETKGPMGESHLGEVCLSFDGLLYKQIFVRENKKASGFRTLVQAPLTNRV